MTKMMKVDLITCRERINKYTRSQLDDFRTEMHEAMNHILKCIALKDSDSEGEECIGSRFPSTSNQAQALARFGLPTRSSSQTSVEKDEAANEDEESHNDDDVMPLHE